MELQTLFAALIDESDQANLALAEEVQAMGADVDKSTTASGKIYRAWMDVKAVFTGQNRKSVLENCHTGEHAALKAYTTALEDDNLRVYLKEMIKNKRTSLKLQTMK